MNSRKLKYCFQLENEIFIIGRRVMNVFRICFMNRPRDYDYIDYIICYE